MPPTQHDALLEQLAGIARLLGADSIALRARCDVGPALSQRLLAAGARRTRRVFHYDGERPYVIETAALSICGLVIESSTPARPASPGERQALLLPPVSRGAA